MFDPNSAHGCKNEATALVVQPRRPAKRQLDNQAAVVAPSAKRSGAPSAASAKRSGAPSAKRSGGQSEEARLRVAASAKRSGAPSDEALLRMAAAVPAIPAGKTAQRDAASKAMAGPPAHLAILPAEIAAPEKTPAAKKNRGTPASAAKEKLVATPPPDKLKNLAPHAATAAKAKAKSNGKAKAKCKGKGRGKGKARIGAMPPMLALVGPGAGAPPALSEHETMPPMSPEILPPMSPEVILITIIIPQTLSMYSQHGTLSMYSQHGILISIIIIIPRWKSSSCRPSMTFAMSNVRAILAMRSQMAGAKLSGSVELRARTIARRRCSKVKACPRRS